MVGEVYHLHTHVHIDMVLGQPVTQSLASVLAFAS